MTLGRTTTTIVTLEPSIASSTITEILISASTTMVAIELSIRRTVKARLRRILAGNHSHMSYFFGMVHGTLEEIFLSFH
jgi:hypothetical protein